MEAGDCVSGSARKVGKNVAGKLILNIDGSNERSGQEISENSLLHRYTSGEYKSNTGASSTDGKTRN